jgi:organic hydroperoxide reductase OsmC/OhrA
MSEDEKTFSVELERLRDYQFNVDFEMPGVPGLVTDESEPVGKGAGPNPSKLLAAAVGNCLSSSLLFCLQRARAPAKNIRTKVNGRMRRNEKGRWRITELAVELTPEVEPSSASQLARCSDIFRDFCIVSQSVENGIPMKVSITPPIS